MKMLILSFALLLATPAIASPVNTDELLSDLTSKGLIVHPKGIWGGK